MTYKHLYFKNNSSDITDEHIDLLKDKVNSELTLSNDLFKYDFCNGFRIQFTDLTNQYYLTIMDNETKTVLFNGIIIPEEDTIYSFEKKYFIKYEIIIRKIQYNIIEPFPIFREVYNDENKDILIFISCDETPVGLGDSIAWITAAYQFKLKHKESNIYLVTSYPDLNDLIEEKYGNIFTILSLQEVKNKNFYAAYLSGCFFDDKKFQYSKITHRRYSLQEYGCHILGIQYDETKKIDFSYPTKTDNKKPYVCISTQASGIVKEWLSYVDIRRVVISLQTLGYDVYDIDLENEHKQGILYSKIPEDAIDMTGNYSLKERAKFISGCEFFIGLSSGLSWLAWSCNKPVVLISGFTSPQTEFYTPYRIINYYRCNSCWNDNMYYDLSKNPCPKSKSPMDEAYLECSTSIKYPMVMNAIKKIPCVQKKIKENGFDI